MRVLHRKLLRDLSRLRGQVITIALVVAGGVASFAVTGGTYDSLIAARDDYYARYGFPDLFCALKRAPQPVAARLAELPGVSRVRTRLRWPVTLPMKNLDAQVTGTVVSAPEGPTTVGNVLVRRGRLPERSDEVAVLAGFFEAHQLALGDTIPVAINGNLRTLRVVGVAMSPEVLFAVAPGELVPDPLRYAVLWMQQDTLAGLLQMKGAFNDVVMALQPGADPRSAVDGVRRVLAPYGGTDPILRKQHPSDMIVASELTQMKNSSTVLPIIFLSVAAFLVSVVLGRLVQLQRPQIAALKAVGYSNRAVGAHFMGMVLVIAVLGAGLGLAVGAQLGSGMIGIYHKYFHFPELRYRMTPNLVVTSAAISAAAATLGALFSVRAVIRLPPAEAMQPEPPAVYRKSLSDRLGLSHLLGQSARMVLREAERRPTRLLLSSLGISGAVALLVVGRFSHDSIDRYMEITFSRAQRQDVTVVFDDPARKQALFELEALPGVLRVEGQRSVPVEISSAFGSRSISLTSYAAGSRLARLVDADGKPRRPPKDGLLLTYTLAELLHVGPGDRVQVRLQTGDRSAHEFAVRGTVREMLGLSGHIDQDGLHRLLGEAPSYSLCHLRIDPRMRESVLSELRARPRVVGVSERKRMVDRFRDQTADQMTTTNLIVAIFAVVIAAGVVYNNARLSLSTRSRDLASLRVLGFRRGEISALLLGELALQVVLSLPPGLWFGRLLAEQMMSMVDEEQFRFPAIITGETYVFAIWVTCAAAAGSALLVRRRLDRLDLTAALKTRG